MHDYGHFLPLDEMLISASCMYLPAFSTCYPNNSQYPFIHLSEEKHYQVIEVSRLSAQHDTSCSIQSSKQEFKCKSKLQYNPGSASILISVFFYHFSQVLCYLIFSVLQFCLRLISYSTKRSCQKHFSTRKI